MVQKTKHALIKILNVQNKERVLRGTKERDQVTYKRRFIIIIPGFSMVTLKKQSQCSANTEASGDRPSYYGQQYFNHNRWIKKTFHGKTKFQQYLAKNTALQKLLEGELQTKEVICTEGNTGSK